MMKEIVRRKKERGRKKYLWALLVMLCFCLMNTVCPFMPGAAVVHAVDAGDGTSGNPWECGPVGSEGSVTATLSGGTLTISGTGNMRSYTTGSTPWYGSRDSITSVVIGEGVTSIGGNAFESCGKLTSVTIPDSVTSIGGYAFYLCRELESVTIGNHVISIADSAFRGCSALTSVTIPDSVTSIGKGAFAGCKGLTSVTIPDSVTSIGEEAFWDCKLTSVTIPKSVTSIGANPFRGCSGLTSIILENGNQNYKSQNGAIITIGGDTLVVGCKSTTTIPDGVTSIGDYAFHGCSELGSVTIPDSVTSIGSHAFQNCSGLVSVTIPASVTSISSSVFQNCSGLVSVTIPDSVTSIGDNAFDNCSGLTNVTIPDSVESIGKYAFYDCSGLASVTIGNHVTSIGKYAFWGCSGLTSVTIPDSVTSIGSQAFQNCSGLVSVTIPDSVTSIGDIAFSGCSELTSVTIGNHVTSIGSQAFYGCRALTSIKIPASVTTIGINSFGGCSGLTSIEVDGENRNYKSENNAIITTEGELVAGCKSTTTIPTSVTSIGSHAFSGCSELTSVTIGNHVTSIGEYAFSGCNQLTSVTVPDSVTSIGEYAFSRCSSLKEVTMKAVNPPTLSGTNTFQNCLFVTENTKGIYVPVGTKGDYTPAEGWSTYEANIAETVTSGTCGTGVNWNFDSATGTLTISGTGAMDDYENKNNSGITTTSPFFGYKHSIKKVVIEEGVKSIGAYVFGCCSSLTSVEIPDSVTSIGHQAFWQCYSLKNVKIGSGVTNIGNEAFSHCRGLENIEIPASVTNMGNYAFFDCQKLTTVTMGPAVPPTLGVSIFLDCPDALTFTVPSCQYKVATGWSYRKLTPMSDDTFHDGFSYTVADIVITQKCACKEKSGTATLSMKAGADLTYTGSAIEPFEVIYNGEWKTQAGNPVSFTYEDNQNAGMATATLSVGTESVSITKTFTIIPATMSVSASGYEGTYDGQSHSITVKDISPADATVTYSADGGQNYGSENPSFTNAGTHTVNYRIMKDNYETIDGSETVTINKQSLTITAEDQSVMWGSSIDQTKRKVDGMITGDDISEITLTPSTTGFTDNGTISISGVKIENASGEDVTGNYEITTVDGTLKVTHDTALAPDRIDADKTKKAYTMGDTLNVDDITVTASYEDGYSEEVTGFTTNVADIDMSKAGEKTLTVSYTKNGGTKTADITITVHEQPVITDGDWSGVSISDGVEIVDYSGSDTAVEVPSEIDGKSVTAIGKDAFADKTEITSVTVPDSVTAIGEGAFAGCTGLTTIMIPEGLDTTKAGISDTAAKITYTVDENGKITITSVTPGTDGDGGKKPVTLPDTIGGQKPEIPDTVKETMKDIPHEHKGGTATCTKKAVCEICGVEYGGFAEHDWSGSWVVTKEPTATEDGVEETACTHGCGEKKQRTIPATGDGEVWKGVITSEGVKIVGYSGSDTAVEVPPEIDGRPVTAIGENAFAGKTEITSVTVPDSVTTIDEDAFAGCTGLTTIVIPDGLDTTKAGISGTAAKITYTVDENGKITITSVTPGTDSDGVEKPVTLPDTIGGQKPAISDTVKETMENITHEHKGGKATCIQKAVCEICGAEYGGFAEHTFPKQWTVEKEATESESGRQYKICETCGTKIYRTIDPLGTPADPYDGKIEKEVEVLPGALDTVLNNSKEELAQSVLEKEELAEVASGTAAKIWLEIASDVKIAKEDKAQVQKAAEVSVGAGAEVACFDASLFKQVGNREKMAIHKTGRAISVTIVIPEKLRNKDVRTVRYYQIIRLHGGKTTLIGGTYNEESAEFTFETDRFSTYALTYRDTTENPTATATSIPNPGDTTEKPTGQTGQKGQTEQNEQKKPAVSSVTKEEQEKNAFSLNAKLKVSQTGRKIKISWGKVSGADGYDVYVQYCGKKFTKKSITAIKSGKTTKVTVKKVNGKPLKLDKNYKIYILAYKLAGGKKITLGKTITAHIVGRKNMKYTNVKAVKVNKSSYRLRKGKTAKIKAKTVLVSRYKKQLTNAHAKQFRYATTNKKVATVSKKGKMKAVGKGTCIIYVYARNGYAKKIKVTVE